MCMRRTSARTEADVLIITTAVICAVQAVRKGSKDVRMRLGSSNRRGHHLLYINDSEPAMPSSFSAERAWLLSQSRWERFG